MTAIRANHVGRDHLVAFGAAGQIDRLFRIVRTSRTCSGITVFSLRNRHSSLRKYNDGRLVTAQIGLETSEMTIRDEYFRDCSSATASLSGDVRKTIVIGV